MRMPDMFRGEVRAQKDAASEWSGAQKAHKAGIEQTSRGQKVERMFTRITGRPTTPEAVRRGLEFFGGGHVATKSEIEILDGYDYKDPADPTGKITRRVHGIRTFDLPGITSSTNAEIRAQHNALDLRAAEAKANGKPIDAASLALQHQDIDKQRPDILKRLYIEYHGDLSANRKNDAVKARKHAVLKNQALEYGIDPNNVFGITKPDPATATPDEIQAYEDTQEFLKMAKDEFIDEHRRHLLEKSRKRRKTAFSILINSLILQPFEAFKSAAPLEPQRH